MAMEMGAWKLPKKVLKNELPPFANGATETRGQAPQI
jgi:hypothetical protein